MNRAARRQGFETEIKTAWVTPVLSGLGRIGGAAISGAMNLGARAAPTLARAGGALAKHAPLMGEAATAAGGALANAGRSALTNTGARQLAGAGVVGAGLLGTGTFMAGRASKSAQPQVVVNR